MKSTIFVLTFLLASPTLAHDFTKPILDQSGVVVHERVKDGVYDRESPVVTLGTVIAAALFLPPQIDPRAPPDAERAAHLAKRAALGLKLRDAKGFDLTADQVVEIKAALGTFPPLTVLRVLEEIDPAAVK